MNEARPLQLDVSLALADAIGARGITREQLEGYVATVGAAQEALQQRRASGELAWMDLPAQDVSALQGFARERRGHFDNLLVLGIGGSALGTIALGAALLHPYHNLLPAQEREGWPRLFVLDNVDPDQTAALFDLLDWERTLVNVVSKSGGTAETAAAYLVARGLLLERMRGGPDSAADALRRHLVFTTDARGGVLREIAQEESIPAFPVPEGVGGRFSVLSAVSLLPAALCGMDVEALLAGAAAMEQRIQRSPALDNPAGLFAAVQHLEYTAFDRPLSVMMPYSARLRYVADWYKQLWAESLGKERNRSGEQVNLGPTPLEALGATDQHSQVQLYSEGPDDKIITFLRVDRFQRIVPAPALHAGKPALAYLGGRDLGELLKAEQRATAWALARRGRPSLRIDLPAVEAHALGQLFMMLEFATALMGELLDVDAFDQPGVELGKQATYALMGRPGFEQLAGEIAG